MTYLVSGIALWILCHSFKRISPQGRAVLTKLIGQTGSKALISLGVLSSLILMVIGYKAETFHPIYNTPSFGIHLNNLLMFVSIGLLGLVHGKSRLKKHVRHPMLTAVITWSAAHLLVNGDVSSVLLFGLLGLWSAALIILINRAEAIPKLQHNLSLRGDIRWLIITVFIFTLISYIHYFLGAYPFPS